MLQHAVADSFDSCCKRCLDRVTVACHRVCHTVPHMHVPHMGLSPCSQCQFQLLTLLPNGLQALDLGPFILHMRIIRVLAVTLNDNHCHSLCNAHVCRTYSPLVLPRGEEGQVDQRYGRGRPGRFRQLTSSARVGNGTAQQNAPLQCLEGQSQRSQRWREAATSDVLGWGMHPGVCHCHSKNELESKFVG